MRNSIFNQVSKTALSLILMVVVGTVTLQAQTANYRCFCDDSFPDGVLGFEITISNAGPNEVWTVDNVINLYSSINPDILIQNNSQIPVDPGNPNEYLLTGFAYDGQMPFVTILDESGVVLDMSMVTCVIPVGEIVGDTELCVGEEVVFDFSTTATNILNNSVSWTANGSSSAVPFGADDLSLRVSYDTPGNYIISVEGSSSTQCDMSDDIMISVRDASDDISISGPDYLCSAAATDITYMVTNPEEFQLQWTSTPASTITPMTGSGTTVDVTFPSADLYILSVENADPDGCTISGVNYAVNVVDIVDTIPILGDTYVCQGGIETYTINNPSDYTDLQWTITPDATVSIFPADGMGDNIVVTYSDPDDYVITLTGTTSDGCTFNSELNVVVPGDDVGTLACNNSVNVSLNNSCILELLPEMILEGEDENNDAYSLIITNVETGEELLNNMVGSEALGEVFNVTVIEECGGNSCWGTLIVEDKSIPSLVPFCEEFPIVTTCFDFDNDVENPTGFPDFGPDATSVYRDSLDNWLVTGFDACNDVFLSFEDVSLTDDICADPQVITRTWTAVDENNGAETSCMVTINVSLLDGSMIVWPKDYDTGLDADAPGEMDTDNIVPSLDACNINNETELLNSGNMWIEDEDGNPSPESTGSPRSDAFACPNLQVIGYKDQVLPVCGSSRKILRLWTVWDACNFIDITHTQIITLMDNTAPICTAPANTRVYTDIHECGADIAVTPPTVTGECDDYSYIVKYKLDRNDEFGTENIEFDTTLNRYVINDVDFITDSIWVQYVVRDACGNETEDCFTEFELIDNEQPIPACDFNNVVTLNDEGWAFAGPNTFDDNSWDNCGIFQAVIQKMDNRCECTEAKFDYLHTLGQYNGHTYYLSKEKIDGYKAAKLSAAIDGYVANVNSQEENDWIRSQVDEITNGEYFIGLSGTSTSSLIWSNGDTTSYRNWYGAEPSLNGSVFAKGDIFVSVNDEGSWNAERNNQVSAYYVIELEDYCAWSQKVNFCCEDVGQETMVALRVIDHSGNHNFCMVNVNVMEFERPFITCPADTIIPCDDSFDISDLTRFGMATATDNCGVKEIRDTNTGINGGSCGSGIIQRTLTAVDYANNERACIQFIRLQDANVFGYDDIVWPGTETVTNSVCTLEGISPDITGRPTWNESAFPCSDVTYTYTDLMFYITDEACQKLVRTWTVVDWCQNNMIWEEVQIIKLENNIAPQIDAESCRPITVTDGIHISECTVRVDGIVANNEFVAGACNDTPNWSYEIDFHDDGTIDRTGNGNDASGNYEYGTHRLTWTIFDECGNESSCDKLITILDHLPPTPYCHGSIVIPLSDTLGVEIWASDLNLGSFDNCPTNPVFFSFAENVLLTNTILTCDDLNPGSNIGTLTLNLWIWDNLSPSLANKSTCAVTINLQDNHNVCDNIDDGMRVATISGSVQTEDLEMVDNVEVSIASNAMESDMMSTDGEFAFDNLEMYYNYSVNAHKDDNYLNGISTLDLVLIQRHILGLQKLDSPYKIIAADINNSESITAIDLIELRKLILGIHEKFPNNNSWRFVESAFNFTDINNPFPFQESVEVDDLGKDVTNANFIGVKIGDVNGSVVSNAQSSGIESRSYDSQMNIDIVSLETSKGNQRLQFVASESMNMLGAQLAMNFDKVNSDLLAMVPMALDISNDHVAWDKVDEGQFLVSWNSINTVEVNKGDVLFELLFKGQKANVEFDAELNNFPSELYTLNNNIVITQSIHYGHESKEDRFTFAVEQNIPNPFNDETVIQFTLEKSGPVVLTVTDQTGRIIHKEKGDYTSGNNSITLSQKALGATGLLYYQISTETQTVTKKMIAIQ